MVVDPLSALSIASSALAFIEFGYKTCRAGREIYKSESGALLDQKQRKIMIVELQELLKNLKNSEPDDTSSSQDVALIQKSVTSCSEQASSLMAILETLELGLPSKRWMSVKKAFMNVWKEREIVKMELKLESLKSQLTLALTTILYDQNSKTLTSLKAIENFHRRMQVGGQNDIQSLRDSLKISLSAASNASGDDKVVVEVKESINRLIDEADKQNRIQQVLRSLRFPSMDLREDSIPTAFAQTFNWIFEDYHTATSQPVPFARWLRKNHNVFWISGKPGSGKSTLMKYLTQQAQLKNYLREWAEPKPLVIAKFYFWYSGSSMQKSQQGLLQSLLYEVLRQCPDAIPEVVPSRWQNLSKSSLYSTAYQEPDSWTRSELLRCFGEIPEQHICNAKFCFFIDGLDEYEGHHEELVEVIQSFNSFSNMKFCVSSRPWNVFDKVFGSENNSSTAETLSLQEFTKEDMRLFIREKLEYDPGFVRFSTQDPQYKEILDDLIERAQGVFLWVHLAVTSLKKGLTNRDTLTHLRKRLHEFPPSLEDYYQRMLDSVDTVYRERTSQMLLMTLCAKSPLYLWIYGFLDEPDPQSAVSMSIPCSTLEDQLSALSDLQRRVNAQCQDLLEVTSGRDMQHVQIVQFMHRTVKDFLTTRAMQKLLYDRLEGPFDPKAYLCRALLAQMKTFPQVLDTNECCHMVASLNRQIFDYAKDIEMQGKCTEHELLDETEKVTIEQSKRWTQAHKLPHGLTLPLCMALQQHMPCYVLHRISRDPRLLKEVDEAPALHWVISGKTKEDIDVTMLRLLLSRGADPNQKYSGETMWATLLQIASDSKFKTSDEGMNDLYEAFEAMIKAGANIDVRATHGWLNGAPLTGSNVIQSIFADDQARSLMALAQRPWTNRLRNALWYK